LTEKGVNPSSRQIRITAKAAVPAVTRNGLSKFWWDLLDGILRLYFGRFYSWMWCVFREGKSRQTGEPCRSVVYTIGSQFCNRIHNGGNWIWNALCLYYLTEGCSRLYYTVCLPGRPYF